MIFSMMSRVSLGHTGRALIPHQLVSKLLLLVFIAAMIRVILPIFNFTYWAWNISALLWILSVSLFLYTYIPILFKPRLNRI